MSEGKIQSSRDARLTETLVRENLVYEGKSVNLRVDEIRLPNGRKAFREFLDHPGAVGIVPFLADGSILLVRQYRHPVGRVTLELPAGKLDKGEAPLVCARRELREETGYSARRFTPLLKYWPTPAFSNELLRLYVAEGLSPGRSRPDADEFLEVVRMPFKKALDLVRSGEIRDSKTALGLAACALWRSRGNYTKLSP